MELINHIALREIYTKADQGHLFSFWDQLNDEQKTNLLIKLNSIDVNHANKIFLEANSNKDHHHHSLQLEPLPKDIIESTICYDEKPNSNIELYRYIGMNALSHNKVAVILLAGGQGTRLGSSEPKGCFDINLPSKKSLFQLQAERIVKLQQLSSGIIPWYIMTSAATRKATKTFFEHHDFFGLNRENITFFDQGSIPAFSDKGKILLESKDNPVLSPNGNGGIYVALQKEGILEDLKVRGIDYVHVYCVDNCMVKVADPVFIGYCISRHSDCGIKVIPKSFAEESVGIICKRNGKFTAVEYSEKPPHLATQRDESGSLLFNAANIANHFFTTEFLKRMNKMSPEMKYHIARKKISHMCPQTGDIIKPEMPNGIKLELFIFDVIPFAKNFAVLEVSREDEFSPLKNAVGENSPITSRRDLLAQGKRWVKKAGAIVGDSVDVEISPLTSYEGEGLEAFKGLHIVSSVIA